MGLLRMCASDCLIVVVCADDEGNDYEWKPSEESYWPEYFVARWFRQKEKMEVPVRLSSCALRLAWSTVADLYV